MQSDILTKLHDRLPQLKKREIEGILNILISHPNLKNNQLITKTGIPKETLRQVKAEMAFILQAKSGDEISLKPEFETELKELNPRPYKWSLLDETMLQTDTKTMETAIQAARQTLTPKRNLDQFFATTQTSINKILVMIDKDSVENKSIALLGDDDLLSVGLSTIYTENQFKNLDIFDVDTELLARISSQLPTENKNIHAYQYDARKPVTPKFAGKYDVVVTDPPYTKAGVSLFLNRAIELVGKFNENRPKYIFLYYGNSFKTPEKTHKIQELINRTGLLIEDKIDKFSRYDGAESIGSASSLYILKVTPFTRTDKSSPFAENIYTFEDQKEEKFPFVDHVVFKVGGVASKLITSKPALMSAIGKLCTEHKLKVMDTKVTLFKGQGMTLTYILANSNLVVHTWPEYSALHVDLITCMPIYNKDGLADSISRLLGTKNVGVNWVE